MGVLVAGGIDRGKAGAVDETDELAVDLPARKYDAAIDHLRYEAADVVYHLLVVLESATASVSTRVRRRAEQPA